MSAHFSIPETVRRCLTSLSRENFALWAFVAQNDLFDEAEEFLNDSSPEPSSIGEKDQG